MIDNLLFGERDALELIALSANELFELPPFHDHPANQDGPGTDETTSTRIRRLLQRRDHIGQEASSKVPVAKSAWFGKLHRQSQPIEQVPSAVARDDTTKVFQSDIDDVFRSFTPRHRRV